ARHPHSAVAGRGRGLCRGLGYPPADAPNLFGWRNGRRGQRAGLRSHPSLLLLPNVARFWGARAVEASREHRPPDERNRATNRNHDLVDSLRLLRTPGIGPVTYRQLIARFGTPAAALAAVPDLARRGGGKI